MGAVTHGADTRRLRAIAEDLQALGGRVGQLEAEGTAQLGVLTEAWSGEDCATFEGDWQDGSTRLVQVEQRLRAYAKVLAEQAEQQETASGNTTGGGSTGPAPRTGEKPGPKGLPKQLRDLGDLFSTPDRPGLAANWTSPHWRWAVRKGVDEGTDWANDLYTDHVRGTPLAPGLPFVEKGLKESSDWVRDLREQRKKTNPSPVDAPGIFLDIVADELDTYGKILEDPKGWWDNDASTWDKIGLGVSLIPVVGVPAKIATKTTKEVADVATDVARHGDDVAKGGKHVDVDSLPDYHEPKSIPRDGPEGKIYDPDFDRYAGKSRQEFYDEWYDEKAGNWKYPSTENGAKYDDGFAEPPRPNSLKVGDTIDRLGREDGKFAAPDGTPFPERALPPSDVGREYHQYKVLKPLPDSVTEGKTAGWFDQPGGGTQYKFDKDIQWYIDNKYLGRVK